MTDLAAHLVDRVLPPVPIRQWVLSFPWPVRFILARDSKLLTKATDVFLDEVFRYYERELIYAKEDLDPEVWRHRRSLPFQEEKACPVDPAVAVGVLIHSQRHLRHKEKE